MSTLTAIGTEILLVYGAKLFPARNGRPGMRCIVDCKGAVLVQAIGYADPVDAEWALSQAADTCREAGLEVAVPPAYPPCLIVRKRRTSSSPSSS